MLCTTATPARDTRTNVVLQVVSAASASIDAAASSSTRKCRCTPSTRAARAARNTSVRRCGAHEPCAPNASAWRWGHSDEVSRKNLVRRHHEGVTVTMDVAERERLERLRRREERVSREALAVV